MIKDIRNSVNSFSMKILLVLLAFSFVLLYGYETTTSCNPGGVARVDGDYIPQQEYIARVRSQIDNYRRLLNRDLDDNMLAMVQQTVLSGMINGMLMSAEAEKAGIGISDELLRQKVRETFANPETKEFDVEFYKNYVMRYLQSSPGRFENQMRSDLAAQRLQDLISNAAKVSQVEASEWHRFENRQMNFDFVKIDPTTVAINATPDIAALEQFFKDNRRDYQSEEARQIEYVELKASDYSTADKEAKVDEEKITAAADKLLARFKANADKPLSELLGDSKAVYQKTKLMTQQETIDGLEDAGTLVNRAFTLAEGELSDKVKGWLSSSYFIMRVVKIEPPKPLEFAEARSQVEVNFLEKDRLDAAEKLVDQGIAEMLAGKELTDFAKKNAVTVEETGFFKRSAGRSIPNVGISSDGAAKLFALSLENPSKSFLKQPLKVGGSYYLFRAKEEKTPELGTDEQLLAEQQRLLDEKKSRRASNWVQWVRERADAQERVKIFPQPSPNRG